MAKKQSTGTIILAVYLFFVALVLIADLSFKHSDLVMGVLAAAAGIFLLIGK